MQKPPIVANLSLGLFPWCTNSQKEHIQPNFYSKKLLELLNVSSLQAPISV